MTTRGFYIFPIIIVALGVAIGFSAHAFLNNDSDESAKSEIVSVTKMPDNTVIVKMTDDVHYYVSRCEYTVISDSANFASERYCSLMNPIETSVNNVWKETDMQHFDIDVFSNAVNDSINAIINKYGFAVNFRMYEVDKREFDKNIYSIK